MLSVNKDQILLEWCNKNPFLQNIILFNFLGENNGQTAIIPISETVVSENIDRSKLINYDFMWQASFELSSNTDNLNTETLFDMRQWQEWIEEQNDSGDLPDFGDNYCMLDIVNLSEMPNLAQTYNNSMAKYQFPARLIYLKL